MTDDGTMGAIARKLFAPEPEEPQRFQLAEPEDDAMTNIARTVFQPRTTTMPERITLDLPEEK